MNTTHTTTRKSTRPMAARTPVRPIIGVHMDPALAAVSEMCRKAAPSPEAIVREHLGDLGLVPSEIREHDGSLHLKFPATTDEAVIARAATSLSTTHGAWDVAYDDLFAYVVVDEFDYDGVLASL